MACSAGFGIDGVSLDPGDHVCGLFFGWLDRDQLLVPFFRAGLAAGDRCVIVTDRADSTPILQQLGAVDDTERWMATGQLQVLTSTDQPEPSPAGLGHEEMVEIWKQAVDGGEVTSDSGFLRIGGEVSWWAPVTSPAEIARYEAQLNCHVDEDMAVLCLYDLSRFSAESVVDAVMTHPVVLVGGRMVDNPWYVPPEDASVGDGSVDRGRPRPTLRDISRLVTSGQPGVGT